MENKITLELSQEEVNQILFALAERPYREVFELVAKIQQQGNEQLQKKSIE